MKRKEQEKSLSCLAVRMGYVCMCMCVTMCPIAAPTTSKPQNPPTYTYRARNDLYSALSLCLFMDAKLHFMSVTRHFCYCFMPSWFINSNSILQLQTRYKYFTTANTHTFLLLFSWWIHIFHFFLLLFLFCSVFFCFPISSSKLIGRVSKQRTFRENFKMIQ